MRRDLQQIPRSRDDDYEDGPEPPKLRFLRRLVTLLMATMIVGIAVVAGALVYRIGAETGGGTARPQPIAEIRLEPGMSVVRTAFRTPDLLALVVRDAQGIEALRLYRLDPASGTLAVADEDSR